MSVNDEMKAYRAQHAVCPHCLTNRYWKTLAGPRILPEIKDENEAHCQCGWVGICHQLVPEPAKDIREIKLDDEAMEDIQKMVNAEIDKEVIQSLREKLNG
jgi:hypothetical protein